MGGFPGGSVVKNLPAVQELQETPGSIHGLGRSSGGGHGKPLQYSCLEYPMDRGAWRATVHGVTKSWTWLKQLHTHEQWTNLENVPDFLKRGPIPTMERNGKGGRDGESLFFLPTHQDTGPGHFLNKEAEHRQARENGHVSCHSFNQKEKK